MSFDLEWVPVKKIACALGAAGAVFGALSLYSVDKPSKECYYAGYGNSTGQNGLSALFEKDFSVYVSDKPLVPKMRITKDRFGEKKVSYGYECDESSKKSLNGSEVSQNLAWRRMPINSKMQYMERTYPLAPWREDKPLDTPDILIPGSPVKFAYDLLNVNQKFAKK